MLENAKKQIERKNLQSSLEKLSPEPQINPPEHVLSEMGVIYPSGNYGARDGIKNPDRWPELILIASFLNTECRNCELREKKLLLETLRNRVEQNYDGFGSTYFKQIFARRYDEKQGKWIVQYSGVGKPSSLKSYFFYNRDDPHSIENYNAVWKVIMLGERTLPCNVTNFLYPSAAGNEKEVVRQAKNRYIPYKGFYDNMKHRLAICQKISCEKNIP